jgi:hypothetical protein
MTGQTPSNVRRARDPVSLGEVEGVFQASLPGPRESKTRSSRRGKEQIRSKTSEKVEIRWSDLRVGDNPWNGTRET